MRGVESASTSKDSQIYKLDKARNSVFARCSGLLAALRAQSGFVRFDIPIGGKFPHDKYLEVIEALQSTLNFMALVNTASATFVDLQRYDERENASLWITNFRKLIADANVTGQAVTTLLTLMSASLTSGQALPPYLKVPEPFQFSQKLDMMDKDLLSVRHIAEPGYASFAVIQISTKYIIDDLKKVLASVKELVGELDFSYHIISTADVSAAESEETLTYTKLDRSSRDKQE